MSEGARIRLSRAPLALAVALLAAAVLGGVRLQLPASAWVVLIITTAAVAWLATRAINLRFGGMLAAGLFASMPLILGNAGSLPVAILLIEIAWLAAIERFQRTDSSRWLAGAAIAVGAGVAVDGDAAILLPALAAGTALALLLIDEPGRMASRVLLWPAVCGVMAAVPFALYLVTHPEWIASRAVAYGLYDSQRFNPLQGAREVTSWVGLMARSETYWHYLDPAFLFLSGSVFLMSAAVLLPVGVARVIIEPRRVSMLLLVGLLAAPLPGALLAQGPFAARFAPAAPFAALLMVMALGYLWASERWWHRAIGVAAALALASNAIAFALTL